MFIKKDMYSPAFALYSNTWMFQRLIFSLGSVRNCVNFYSTQGFFYCFRYKYIKTQKGGIYWCITRVMAVTACHMLCRKSLAKWKFRLANISEWYLGDHWNYWKCASYFIIQMSNSIPHSFIYSLFPNLPEYRNLWRSIIKFPPHSSDSQQLR